MPQTQDVMRAVVDLARTDDAIRKVLRTGNTGRQGRRRRPCLGGGSGVARIGEACGAVRDGGVSVASSGQPPYLCNTASGMPALFTACTPAEHAPGTAHATMTAANEGTGA